VSRAQTSTLDFTAVAAGPAGDDDVTAGAADALPEFTGAVLLVDPQPLPIRNRLKMKSQEIFA
jgi:hypothetical protein